MPYIINKNKVISITRGDYVQIPFRFEKGDFPRRELVEIGDNDIIFFGLMDPNQHFEHALVKKEFSKDDFDSEGNFILTIDTDDTLELMCGTYYYEIKLLTEDAHITTLVQKTKFIIVD